METAEIKAVPAVPRAKSAAQIALMRRLVGLSAALASGAVLLIAAWLTPSETGLGTHTELVPLQQCGWIVAMDCPCPTCGMTTAFAHAANGNMIASFLTQPLGSILAVATAMTFLLGSFVAVTGSRIAHRLTRLWHPRMVYVIAALLLGSWVYKILSYKGMI